MQQDEDNLRIMHPGAYPVFRIFSFKPKCVSLGYSQDLLDIISPETITKEGWHMVKRPTGGGLVFHQESDISFSIVAMRDAFGVKTRPQQIYQLIAPSITHFFSKMGISAQVVAGVRVNNKISYCFDFPANYEITHENRKLFGYAQKHVKDKVLVQGTIFVNQLPELAAKLKINADKGKFVCMQDILGQTPGFNEIAQCLIEAFSTCMQVKFIN